MGKVKSHQKLPTEWNEREVLRDKGQFWTPSWVAEAMVAYVADNTDLVFDPATGRGAFYEALLQLNKTKVSFFGTDIDTEVLEDEIYNHKNCFVEKRDFIKNPPQRKFKAIVANPPYINDNANAIGTCAKRTTSDKRQYFFLKNKTKRSELIPAPMK